MTTTIDPSACMQVYVQEEQDTWDANPTAVGIAFAVALIAGGLIAFGCAKLCMKDFIKHKNQDAENGYMNEHHIAVNQKQQLLETHAAPNTKGRRKRTKGRKKLHLRSGEDGAEPLLAVSPIILDGDDEGEGKKGKGLLDALVKDSGLDMETELANQDIDAITRLEKEFREQNIDTMLQLLRTLLNKQLRNGKLTPEQSQELMRNATNNMDQIVKTCQQERDDEEGDLRRKTKDPEKLNGELDKLNSKYNRKMTNMLQDEKDRLRQDLAKVSDLSDIEIDSLLAELTRNMADLEHQLSAERMRQAGSLEERLAKRRLLAQQQRNDADQQLDEIHMRTQTHSAGLNHLVKDGKLLERQKEELLAQYNDDLVKLQHKHDEEFQRQKLILAEKLRQRRENQMTKLATKHDKQKSQFVNASDQMTDTNDLVSSYHEMLQRQRQEVDDVNDELDDSEADEIRKLARGIEKDRNVEIHQREEKFEEDIRNKAQLTDRELDRIMAIHQQQMEEYHAQRKAEKKRMKAAMEEKLQQRRLQVDNDQRKALAEESALREQQDATINKVLQSQVELSNEDKEKILKEHEQNVSMINNQLQMSRLRQQKQLEAKLNQRRARVEDMKKQVQETEMSRKKDKEKQIDALNKQIAEEEARMEADRKVALAEARERMAKETQQALDDQEKQIGLLIARLQVGQARRQALILRQDRTIKDLEEKLSTRVADKVEEEGGGDDAAYQVDHILQSHMNQVSSLNDRLQDVKDRQNQILQEKIQQKKLKKEREIERNLENEVETEYQDKQRRGTLGRASALLGQFMLESRHKMAMNQLEQDMQADMAKQREELNNELEVELQRELEDQKKSFMSQLAAISDLSKDEMNDLVTSAVVETGGDDDQVKQLSKDMRIGIKRAKSELHMDTRPQTGKKKVLNKRTSQLNSNDYEDSNYDNRGYDNRGYDDDRQDNRRKYDDYDDYDHRRNYEDDGFDDRGYDERSYSRSAGRAKSNYGEYDY